MEIPKSIKDLPREKLEEFCVNLMDSEHKTVHRANDMEECIKEIEKYISEELGIISEHQYARGSKRLNNITKIIDKYRKWFDE